MRLIRTVISATALNAMASDERVLVVSLAHAANEINVFRKLTLLSSNFDRSSKWQQDAQTCQFLALLRVTTGKLYEAWQLLGTTYFRSKLSIDYKDKLDSNGQDAIAFLKTYFGRADSLVAKVRNEFAFHYRSEHLGTTVVDPDDQQELSLYLSEIPGNILYYFAEHIAGTALLKTVGTPDLRLAVGKLLTEVAEVISQFNTFSQVLISVLIDHALPGTLETLTVDEPLDVDIPSASEVAMPYYVDFSNFALPPTNGT